MIGFLENIGTERRMLVGPILLAGLLFLRLPYITTIGVLFHNKTPFPFGFVFYNDTFIFTPLLIWWERNRLREFHISRGVLVIFIWAPLVSLFLNGVFNPRFTVGQIHLFQMLFPFGYYGI